MSSSPFNFDPYNLSGLNGNAFKTYSKKEEEHPPENEPHPDNDPDDYNDPDTLETTEPIEKKKTFWKSAFSGLKDMFTDIEFGTEFLKIISDLLD